MRVEGGDTDHLTMLCNQPHQRSWRERLGCRIHANLVREYPGMTGHRAAVPARHQVDAGAIGWIGAGNIFGCERGGVDLSGRADRGQSPSATPSRRGSAPPIRRPSLKRMIMSPLVISLTFTLWPNAMRAAASFSAAVPASNSVAPLRLAICGKAAAAAGQSRQSGSARPA